MELKGFLHILIWWPPIDLGGGILRFVFSIFLVSSGAFFYTFLALCRYLCQYILQAVDVLLSVDLLLSIHVRYVDAFSFHYVIGMKKELQTTPLENQ